MLVVVWILVISWQNGTVIEVVAGWKILLGWPLIDRKDVLPVSSLCSCISLNSAYIRYFDEILLIVRIVESWWHFTWFHSAGRNTVQIDNFIRNWGALACRSLEVNLWAQSVTFRSLRLLIAFYKLLYAGQSKVSWDLKHLDQLLDLGAIESVFIKEDWLVWVLL